MARRMLHGASDPRAVMPEDDETGEEGIAAPEPGCPYWRFPSGERLSVRLLLAGQPRERAELIVELHAEAIRALIWGAGLALLRGDGREMRRLAAGASRLCEELAGFWGAEG
jgi:hypothetical protein